MAILEHHSSDLLHYLLDLGDCSVEAFDKKLAITYGINFENFQKLIKDLVPLCDKQDTSNGVLRGFGTSEKWFVSDGFVD